MNVLSLSDVEQKHSGNLGGVCVLGEKKCFPVFSDLGLIALQQLASDKVSASCCILIQKGF